MAKNQTKNTSCLRGPKAKTPAQLAKAKANIEVAAQRLKALQFKAKLARQLREEHDLTGTDDTVIADYMGIVECDVALWEADQEAQYVAEALAGPSAYHLNRWLAGRAATYDRVIRFFEKSGLPRVTMPVMAKAA